MQAAALGHGIVGVADQVVENLAQASLEKDGGWGFAALKMEFDPALTEAGLVHAGNLGEHVAELHKSSVGVLTVKTQGLEDDIRDSGELGFGLRGETQRLVESGRMTHQKEQVRDGFERVIDLVGDGRRELADGGEFFTAP